MIVLVVHHNEIPPAVVAELDRLRSSGIRISLERYRDRPSTDKIDAIILVDAPDEDLASSYLALRASGIPGLRLWMDAEAEPEAWRSVQDPVGATALLVWALGRGRQRTSRILESYLAATSQHLLFLDGEDAIAAIVPDDSGISGIPSRSLVSKHLDDFFGRSADGEATEGIAGKLGPEERMVYIEGEDDRINAYSALKLPLSLVDDLGPPPGAETVVLLTRTDQYQNLDLKHRRLEEIRTKMIEQRAVELSAANELLEKQASQLKEALELLNYNNRQLMEELNLASELQKSFLPRDYPSDLPLVFSHKYVPLSAIGGDFFDLVRLDKHRLAMVIADVSGHGVGPALVTAMFKSAFDHRCRTVDSPAETMAALNSEMITLLQGSHYLTAFYAIIDTETMEIRFCNAGHPKQLLIRADGSSEELGSMGFLLGMMEGMEYGENRTVLGPGDSLVLFTDGVMETPGTDGKAFGREGIRDSILRHRDEPIEALSNSLFGDLIQFMSEPTFQDDVSFVITQALDLL